MGVAAAAAVLVPAGMVAALATSEDSDNGPSGSASSATREFAPSREGGAGSAEPFPSDPQSAEQYPIARVNKRTALYREPGGKVRLRVAAKTEWDSPRILSVVERRGRWLAVLVPELKNGQQAWVRDDKVANISSVTWSLHADLSKRTTGGAPQRQDGAHHEDRRRPHRPPDARGPLRGHRQAARQRPGLAVRLLRAGADRPPDPAARRAGPAATAWPCTPPAT